MVFQNDRVRLRAEALRVPGIFVRGDPGIGHVVAVRDGVAWVRWQERFYEEDECGGAPVEVRYLKRLCGGRRLGTLFRWGAFMSASGRVLDWKIECDGLTDGDWECIANVMVRQLQPFERVHGIPRGGVPFAAALAPHCKSKCGVVLLADDVWTTGKSMMAFAETLDGQAWIGAVAFARGELPGNVVAFAEIPGEM